MISELGHSTYLREPRMQMRMSCCCLYHKEDIPALVSQWKEVTKGDEQLEEKLLHLFCLKKK